MADRHPRTSLPPGNPAGTSDDSFSDELGTKSPSPGIDRATPLDSDADSVRTDIPERIDQPLPGEAALVYQFLRGRLATLFDDAG